MKLYTRTLLALKTILAIGLFVLLGLIVMPVMASDRFVNNGDGTVTDTMNRLMWSAADNGSHINWKDARSYCQSYSVGGHTDWRMPTLAELKSLYTPVIENERGYHITTSIGTTAESCWASETRGNEAARFNFRYGQEYWLRQFHSGSGRALPVRSAN
ncbi:MAG: hypothetical protein BBJ57_05070 [Desulfobacterales bacterium PC51MH44]|nr:MAG: hypothetical protein BBJ57_05070 [Desulfobacterales bacterium PC51MH44]